MSIWDFNWREPIIEDDGDELLMIFVCITFLSLTIEPLLGAILLSVLLIVLFVGLYSGTLGLGGYGLGKTIKVLGIGILISLLKLLVIDLFAYKILGLSAVKGLLLF